MREAVRDWVGIRGLEKCRWVWSGVGEVGMYVRGRGWRAEEGRRVRREEDFIPKGVVEVRFGGGGSLIRWNGGRK